MNYREIDLPYERDSAHSLSEARVTFIRSTYAHLAGSLLALAAIETVLLLMFPDGGPILGLFAGGNIGLLLLMGAFIGASFLAQYWAQQQTSVGLQYAGLGLYVVAESIILFPLLWLSTRIVDNYGGTADYSLIGTAGILTLAVFFGLTVTVFLTGKDFSFLYPVLAVGTLVAVGLVIAAIIFGFSLGLFFSFAMVALMSGWLLFQTSTIMRTYPTNMPVAAALALFASVATLFFYILRILNALNGRR